jgi:hypothetical protein
MTDYKREMIGFKREMTDFKKEMTEFKKEMTDFKKDTTDNANGVHIKLAELTYIKETMYTMRDDMKEM